MSAIEDRVNEVLSCAGDPEVAHSLEDEIVWDIALQYAPEEVRVQIHRGVHAMNSKLDQAIAEQAAIEIADGVRKPKFEDVELEIRKLAREFPQHTAVCYYGGSGEPCCIVGTALHRAGVPVATLEAYDDDEDGVCASGTMDFEGAHANASKWVNRVQSEQDGGATWRLAVNLADKAFPL